METMMMNSVQSPLVAFLMSSQASFWTSTANLVLLELLSVAIRRLYFSPISHIPGPKLAAITGLHEMFYDLYLNGQYTLHFQSLHEKYG